VGAASGFSQVTQNGCVLLWKSVGCTKISAPLGIPCMVAAFSLFGGNDTLFHENNTLFRFHGKSLKNRALSAACSGSNWSKSPKSRFIPCKIPVEQGNRDQRHVRAGLRTPPLSPPKPGDYSRSSNSGDISVA
jgi:hypothetical protein